ncbi:hypothetical protein DFS34DRAFT_658178 [Phlyctochytrium arcticum]|nr:hypothetical protein DFS34DRAFT_658178 [Phlyctochytrium arcticum]
MELKKLELREKLTRTWYKEPERLQLPARLYDVTIQVYPNIRVAAADAIDISTVDETPEACIPAHSVILAGRNKYFLALFTNGMAQSTLEHSLGGGKDTLLAKRPTVIKIQGYPLSIWDLEDWKQVLQIADEYEDISLFDNISILMMAKYLEPAKEDVYKNVILLLKIAYKYSRGTSELLRKGCISFCTDIYYFLIIRTTFTKFLRESACRDLTTAMTLKFEDIVEKAKAEGKTTVDIDWIPFVKVR